jgi:hypothetical protein
MASCKPQIGRLALPGCPFRRIGSPGLWTARARLDIVALMQLLSGKDAATHVAGILHPKYQLHGFCVHLTARKIYVIDPVGKLDFGGGEYVPAGRVEIAPHQLRPEDKYLWWELGRESYFVECNETLSLASDQIALIEPEDRLLRAGGWHVPLFVRGHLDPVELLLTVGVMQLRVKENARLARVRLFRIDDTVKSARAQRKRSSPKPSRSKRK